MSAATEHVMSLLASLGFDAGSDPSCEIMIDTFDQWSNSDAGMMAGTCAGCTMLVAN
jgi:hypothetical protein